MIFVVMGEPARFHHQPAAGNSAPWGEFDSVIRDIEVPWPIMARDGLERLLKAESLHEGVLLDERFRGTIGFPMHKA